MQRFLNAFLLMLFTLSSQGQIINLSMYYSVPPTSGCNGILALDGKLLLQSCSTPYTYSSTCGTVPGNFYWHSDTLLYTSACSLPCDIDIFSAAGGCVGHFRQTATGLDDESVKSLFSYDYLNNNLIIKSDFNSPAVVRIFSLEGKEVQRFKINSNLSESRSCVGFAKGIYLFAIYSEEEILFRGRFLIMQ